MNLNHLPLRCLKMAARSNPIGKQRRSLVSLTLASTMFIAGCAINPKEVSDDDVLNRIQEDKGNLFAGQEPISGPIGIGEVLVRAIQYNLDSRVKRMELAVATRDLDFSEFALLPDLVASAGYNERSNDPGARSINTDTGEESLPPSRSQERVTETRDLEFMWNILDFGISYHTAHQKADEVSIALERQRKTIQNIAQDVVDAFWKAWVAQEMDADMEQLLKTTENAIAQSATLSAQQSQSKKEALRYQTSLLSIRNSLYEMKERLGLAKIRLAALINIAPDADYSLKNPSTNLEPGQIRRDFKSLADNALTMRPELREEDYRKRISQREIKKSILRMFPTVQIGTGYHANENEFLINDDWTDVSADISWNILGLFGINAERKFREAQVDLADARRLALSMAVMTQVKLSMERYNLSLLRYQSSQQLTEATSDYASVISSSSNESELDKIRARSDALVSQLRTNFSYAEAQSSFARVVNSIGIDLVPDAFQAEDAASRGAEMEAHWAGIKSSMM